MREAAPAVPLHFYTEAFHHRQRDFDIRLGDQLADHIHGDFSIQQWQCHQQSRQELAGHVPAHADAPDSGQRCRMDLQRRKTLIVQAFDIGAEFAQRIDQVADRPLVHARHPRQPVLAPGQRQRRRQRAERGAGIAEKQLRLPDRKIPAAAGHAEHQRFQLLHIHAQHAQGIEHARGIVGQQHIAYFGRALRQRRQQQDAVGNAFRAGQRDRAARADQWGKIDEVFGRHCS